MPIGKATAITVLVLAAMQFSCGEEPVVPDPPTPIKQPEERQWPSGTAFAMGDIPIDLAEIDRIAAWTKLLQPGLVQSAQRRSAMTTFLLERAALENAFGESKAAKLAEVRLRLEHMAGADDLVKLDGGWSDLGLCMWATARDLPVGTWSEPIHDIGRWLLIRVTEARPGVAPGADEFAIETLSFPFVPPAFGTAGMEQVLKQTTLTPVDPDIANLIPAAWRYRLAN